MKRERRCGGLSNERFLEVLRVCGRLSYLGKTSQERLKKLSKWKEFEIRDIYMKFVSEGVKEDLIIRFLSIIQEQKLNLNVYAGIALRFFYKFRNMIKNTRPDLSMKWIIQELDISSDEMDFEESLRYRLEYEVGAR